MAQILELTRATTGARLGETLQACGVISAPQLEAALKQQRRVGGRIGELLVMEGSLTWPSLAHAVAQQQGISSVDLLADPCDARLLQATAVASYQAHAWIPWRLEAGVMIVAATDPSPLLLAEVRRWVDEKIPVLFRTTSPRDLRYVLALHFGNLIDGRARDDLFQRYPLWSSRRRPLDRWMLMGLYVFLAVIMIAPLSGYLLEAVLVFANLLF